MGYLEIKWDEIIGDKIGSLFSVITNKYPIIILVIFILFSLALLWRILRGDELKIWKIELKSNKLLEQQKKLFEALNEDAKQKNQIIKLLDQINQEISKSLFCPREEFNRRKSDIYSFILHGIIAILTKQKGNSHRVAIFVLDDDSKNLKIYEGLGFSPEGKSQLRLPINDSHAGYVFNTGKALNDGDITGQGKHFKPNPKSKKIYHSLMCTPIIFLDKVIGVLSLDGEEKNSFTKDDEDYLKYFANALSSLMIFDTLFSTHEERGEIEGGQTA